ncbi:hypothetical protein [Kribbella sp. NPDC000426]|uniref:hypothetical protein n=1 Tax=Kribbella sp. NPDC000426 TaxID=3154255 RepID=UPI00332F75F8
MHPTTDSGPRRDRWLIATAVLAVLAIVAVLIVVLVKVSDEQAGTSGSPTGPVPTVTQPGPTVTTTVVPSQGQSPSTTPTASATTALEPFLSAAVTLDRQLQAAAAAINASGPPWSSVGPSVARSVRTADLGPVSRAIPAGLPQSLQQSVVLVLSDLSSRRYALASFEQTPPVTPHGTTADLLRELSNGHPAAARFDRDLATLRAIASETAPIAAVPQTSRLTAEAMLLARYVNTANGGCESRGGVIVTELPKIVWKTVPGLPDAKGTINGISFSADLSSSGTWTVNLYAC